VDSSTYGISYLHPQAGSDVTQEAGCYPVSLVLRCCGSFRLGLHFRTDAHCQYARESTNVRPLPQATRR